MPVENIIGSNLVRFTEKQKHITVHNLRTGEKLSFETCMAAWLFLEDALESPASCCVEKPP